MKTSFTVLSWERASDHDALCAVPGVADRVIRIDDLGHLRSELSIRTGTVALSTHGHSDRSRIGPLGRRGWFQHAELGLESVAATSLIVLACHQDAGPWGPARMTASTHTYEGLVTPGIWKAVLQRLVDGKPLTQSFTDALQLRGHSPYRPELWQHVPAVDA
jgi:hypothetical protein